MKYGRWKKRSRELAAEYEQARTRPVSVYAFGAQGDWVHDDAPAIQAAIYLAAKTSVTSESVPGSP